MALIVEDGSGLSNAESFISVADADTYFTNRGNASWDAISTEAEKEVALRKATDYMEQTYRSRWVGVRVSATQALSWPRLDVEVDGFPVDGDVVPVEVERACAELALRAHSAALLADVDKTTPQVIREKLDVMEVQYSDNSSAPGYIQYSAVDRMLAPYLPEGSGRSIKSIELTRA